MAIQKSKTLENGAVGTYWKIITETYNKRTLLCTIQISLFLNKDISDIAGKPLGLTKTFIFTVTKDELAGNRTALAYAKIKAQVNSNNPKLHDADLADGVDV